MLATEVDSKEKIATERNTAMLENSKLRAELKGNNLLPDMLYREYTEIVRVIAQDSKFNDLAKKERLMNEALSAHKKKPAHWEQGVDSGVSKRPRFDPSSWKLAPIELMRSRSTQPY